MAVNSIMAGFLPDIFSMADLNSECVDISFNALETIGCSFGSIPNDHLIRRKTGQNNVIS